jgi:hypothetical protein
MMARLNKFLSSERKRLVKLIAAGQKKLTDAASEVAALKRHLQALRIFETTTKGKRGVRRKRRGRGPSRRTRVLKAIQNSANGMTRQDILEKLKAKGNKAAEQSVSNALAYLKKAGKVKSQNGHYTSV